MKTIQQNHIYLGNSIVQDHSLHVPKDSEIIDIYLDKGVLVVISSYTDYDHNDYQLLSLRVSSSTNFSYDDSEYGHIKTVLLNNISLKSLSQAFGSDISLGIESHLTTYHVFKKLTEEEKREINIKKIIDKK